MKSEWKTYIRICVAVFILYLAMTYWENAAALISKLFSAAFPLFTGAALAYILNIPMSFYERHYFPKKNLKAVEKHADRYA